MSSRDALAALVLVAVTAPGACAKPKDAGQGVAVSPSAAAPSGQASAEAASEESGADGGSRSATPWPALVRDEQWDAAWRSLEALPEAERGRPEVRYVRARVALTRGQPAVALPLLVDLDASLPLLTDDIARRRHEAMLAVGPYEEAAAWFAARAAPSSQLDAARAYEKAKDARHARAAADRVVSADKHTRAQEAEARALRVRVGAPPGDPERADARWLAIRGADLAAAADALALVARIDGAHPLTADELVARAKVLSDAGRADDALHALDLAAGAPGAASLSNPERAHARGMTLYHARGRGLEAAKALTESAATGGPHAAEDAFHAARALSRADKDEEAIRGYEDVERRFPRTRWSEQAAFFVPYLRMLHGEWKECARGFAAYLRQLSTGTDAADARRDGALCALLDGQSRPARVTFEHLLDDETDAAVSARMADLAALASLRDGDRTHALARWTEVARAHPLSWAALVARARLAEAGAPVPPAIDPAESPTEPSSPLAVTLPPPADLLHRIGLDADAEVAVRARESALTASAGARGSEALCAAYGELGRARRRFQIAQTLPSALFTTAPGARTRWAWECEYPAPYGDVVRAAETAEKLPTGLLWSVMRQESAFDPDAVSPARAVGLMQLLPEVARPDAEELALPHDDARLTSPPYAIRVGAHELRKLLDQFHGVTALAVAAYNAGAESVSRWVSRAPGMQLDTFVERIPFKETRDYVGRVMGNLARYGYLAQGEAGVPRVELELPR